MCDIITPIVAAFSGAAGTATAAGAAAGATAAGAGIGATLQTIGTIASIGGTLVQGVQANRAAKSQAAALEVQKQTEAQLNSVRDQRMRKEFRHAMAQQRAELAARGISADSPTAVFLGQTAAQEMTFESQSIRQTGQATQTELSNSQRQIRARGRQSLFRGGMSAAGSFLTKAPELWPELLS